MKFIKILFPFILLFTLLSCKKTSTNCFDAALYEQYKNAVCTQDCPGVIGCDDKQYCNACIAQSQGIRLK